MQIYWYHIPLSFSLHFFFLIMMILKLYLSCVHLILGELKVSPMPTLCHSNEVQFMSVCNYTACVQSARFLKRVYHI